MIVLAVVVFALLVLYELPKLVREKKRRELAVYAVLSAITLVYIIRFAAGRGVFSPIKELSRFVGDTLHLSYEIWQGHS